jgi:TP901 family phage tail tape measure protein
MRQVTTAAGGMGGGIARTTVPLRMFGDSMRQTATLLKYSLIGQMIKIGQQSIKMSRDFEMSMAKIKGLVGVSSQEVSKFKNEILKLAGSTTRTPLELADALYFITSSGIRGAEATGILEQSARSAAAGLGETKVVADALTSALNAYGPGALTAAHANNVLVATVREGKAAAETFAPALGKILPIAAATGVSIEDVSAAMAAMTRTGTTAGSSAVYLRQVISQLLKPSKSAREAFAQYGTSAEEVRKNITDNGLLSALSELNKQMGGSDTKVMNTELVKVFGNVRAVQAVFSLLGPNIEKNKQIFYELNNATGAADEAMKAYQQTAQFKFNQAISEGQAAMVQLGDAIMPLATSLVEIGGIFAQVGGTILRFTVGSKALGGIIRFLSRLVFSGAAAFLLMFKILSSGLQTWSAMVRMWNHGGNVLRGLTNGVRLHNGQLAFSTKQTIGLASADIEATAAQNAWTTALAATGPAAATTGVSMEELILALEATATGETQLALENAYLSGTFSGVLVPNIEAARIALVEAGIASYGFGESLMTMLPMVFGIGVAIFTVASMFGMFGKSDTGLEAKKKSIGELTDVLGSAVSLAKIGINVNVNISTDANAGPTHDEIIAFRDSLSEDLKGAIKFANEQGMDAAGKSEIGANIVGRLKFESPEAKKKFEDSLAGALGLNDSSGIEKALSKQGAAGTSAGISSGLNNLINIAITNTANSGDTNYRKTALIDAIQQGGLFDTDKLFQNIIANAGGNKDSRALETYFTEPIKNVGMAVGEEVNKLGDFSTFTEGYKKLQSSLSKTKLGSAEQNSLLKEYTTQVFSSIDATNEFGHDLSGEGGGLAHMFSIATGSGENHNKQMAGLVQTMSGYTGSAEDAEKLIKRIDGEFKKQGPKTQSEEFKILNDVMSNYTTEAKAAADAGGDVSTSTYDAATAFGHGLNPIIEEAVTQFEALKGAMDNYKKGQEALIGLTQDSFITAQIAANDSVDKFQKTLAAAGGKVGLSGKQGEAMQALQKLRDDYLQVYNEIAKRPVSEGGGIEQANKFLGDKMAQTRNMLVKGGVDVQTAQKELEAIGFGNPAAIASTLIGKDNAEAMAAGGNEISTSIIKGLTDGFSAGLGTASPEIQKFNTDVLNQFLADWGIASPSKVAHDEIGTNIGLGLINGIMTTLGDAKDLGGKAHDIIISSLKTALGIKSPSAATYAVGVFTGQGFIMGTGDTMEGGAGGLGDAAIVAIGGITAPAKKTAKTAGEKAAEAFFASFKKQFKGKAVTSYLDALSKIKTPATDLINKVIQDSSSALSVVGDYFSAQISLQKALVDESITKLNQQGYASNIAKASLEAVQARRKFGADLGAKVTDYEASQIEELQKAYEKVSRDYAMRRATYSQLVDAEDALNSARLAATSVAPEAISAETQMLDAQLKLKTAGVEAATAVLDVVKAQGDLVDKSILFRINGELAAKVFNTFSEQIFPNMQVRLDGLTGTVTEAGKALNTDSAFAQNLRGLGNTIYNSISAAIQEAIKTSTIPDFFKGLFGGGALPTAPTAPATGGGGGGTGGTGGGAGTGGGTPGTGGTGGTGGTTPDTTPVVPAWQMADAAALAYNARLAAQTQLAATSKASALVAALTGGKTGGVASPMVVRSATLMPRALGGTVGRNQPYLVGERGPELFVPSASGYIQPNTALQKMTYVQTETTKTKDSSSWGPTVNITVNNPLPEPASDSISRRMKALSSTGLFG